MNIIVNDLLREPLSDDFRSRLLKTLLKRAQAALSNPTHVEDAMAASEIAFNVYTRLPSLGNRALLWGFYASDETLRLRPSLPPTDQMKMVDRLAEVMDVLPTELVEPFARVYSGVRDRVADDINDWKRVSERRDCVSWY